MAKIPGTNASEVLRSGAASDHLIGLGGNDTLLGGAGKDTLEGGTGIDSLVGGTGNDFYRYTAAPGKDKIVDSGGTDTVLSTVTFNLANYGSIENLTLQGTGSVNGTGNGLKNKITGNSGRNILKGGAGNDNLSGAGGNDKLDGGEHNDVLLGGEGADSLQGGTGNDKLDGGGGVDTLNGGVGRDLLQGGAGNDVVFWDEGDSTVDGGADSDTLRLTGTAALNLVTEDTVIRDAEIIDLAGTNTLTVDPESVKGLSTTTDTLLVKGGTGDAVLGGAGWSHLVNVETGGQTYAEYVKDGATVQVDLDADRDGILVADMSLGVIDGTNGYAFSDAALPSQVYASTSVASAGDVNGDGFDDFILGITTFDYNTYPADIGGMTYVVFGASGGLGLDFALSDLDGANGFRIAGVADDQSGTAVSSAGDVNADGYDDLIVGAPAADGDFGGAYVVFGGESSSFEATLELSGLDGTSGFFLVGAAEGDRAGAAVSGAGDVDGDGYDDLLIGAPGANSSSGASYVVFGGDNTYLASLDGAGLGVFNGNVDAGLTIHPVEAGDRLGMAVSGGDVNGDGYGDLVIGADYATAAGSGSGATYVIFGEDGGFGASFELSDLDGANGIALFGVPEDFSGESVSVAGDVNGDGYKDLIIGARLSDPNGISGAGASYVVFGGDAAHFAALHGATGLSLSDLDGSNGFRISGVALGDSSGSAVSGAGDLNGDGYDDLVVGTGSADTPVFGSGASYVVFGAPTFGANLDLSGLDGANGLRLIGSAELAYSGVSLSSGGDLNGDGFGDLIVGNAASAGPGGHVVFGRDFTGAVTHAGTTEDDDLAGTAGADVMVGGLGNDSFDGGEGQDVFHGGAGDDVFTWEESDLRVNGGSGDDRLRVTDDGEVDLATIAARATDIEAISLEGDGALIADAANVRRLSGTGTLRIDGGPGDSVTLHGSWDRGADVTIGGQVYARYTQGAATLQVDTDVDRSGIGVIAEIDLSSLDGANGFKISGVAADDRSGFSVSAAGDVNGDGLDDLIVGAYLADPNGNPSGASYVVFGAASGYGDNLDLSALDGVNGFRISGEAALDSSGLPVSSAGDLNADGFSDLIIGAFRADPHGSSSGASYVVFGAGSGFASNLDLSALDGSNGFQISGVAESDFSGVSASAEDLNGDGFSDLIIGAFHADPNGSGSGASYVVFGAASGFASNLELSALDGANGFRISGEAEDDRSGLSVSAAGDVNGDGMGDLIVGALFADPNGSNSGASYVVFGTGSGFASNLDLSALDGTNGFQISGEAAQDLSGRSVAAAGDVNGDSFADLIVGAYGASSYAGASYVVFGTGSGFASNLELSALDGTNGFRISGGAEGDYAGYSVSGAGDVNGDGFGDVIVGAWRADPNGSQSGASYVVFGAVSGFASNLELSALDGANGFRIFGEAAGDESGRSVSAAGDLNGDGYDDLIVGANSADPNGNDGSGASYVLFGRDFTGAVTFQGSSGADTMTGTGAAEVLVAGRGNDTMAGGGGADVFRGGAGNDRIVVTDSGFADVDGGSGDDTLALTGGGLALDLTAIRDSEITGIEAIDLTGSGNDTLVLTTLELLNLSDTSNTLRVDGNAGDAVSAAGGWTRIGDASIDGQVYAQYTQGDATLQVDLDIDRSGVDLAMSTLALSALDGSNGFRLDGTGGSGRGVGSAGDYNNDGYDDVLIGAWNANDSFVVFGGASSGSSLSLAALDGESGVRFNEVGGRSVSSAGDINGDGISDFITGGGGGNGAGRAHVVFGSSTFSDLVLEASDLDGANGFLLDGIDNGDLAGSSVAGIGDVNGDGFGDLLVGAPFAAGHAGESYIVFGHDGAFDPVLSLADLDGSNGFRLDGITPDDEAGWFVNEAGDLNGDGFDDFAIGSWISNGGAGETALVFGSATAPGSALSLSGLDGSNGFRMSGVNPGEYNGYAVDSAGDINGDGIGDLIVGAYGASGTAGASYVIFGTTGGFSSLLSPADLDGDNGFRIDGIDPGDYSGESVAGSGDFNGDGYDDVVIGADRADGSTGETYVVFGGGSHGSAFSLSALDGIHGFRLDGIDANDQSGFRVESAGDVNGDGFYDVIIGAHNANADAGESYVIYGRDTGAVDFLGGAGDDALAGTSAAEALVGGDGSDTMTGGGGADALSGGAGDDWLVVPDASFLNIDGGRGIDTLALAGSGKTLTLGEIGNAKLTGIEIIDITGSGNNTLNLTFGEVLVLSDTSNTLRVMGNTGDAVQRSDGWTQGADQEIDGQVYRTYAQGAATLLVDADISAGT